CELVTDLIHAKNFERAGEIAHDIKGADQRDNALKELTRAVIKVEEFRREEILSLALKIEDNYKRADALRELAASMAKAQDSQAGKIFEEAEAAANAIEDASTRADALRELGVALARAGDGRTDSVFEQAVGVTRNLGNNSALADKLRKLAAA